MSHPSRRWLVAAGLAGAIVPLVAQTVGAAGTTTTGPSTVTTPYVLPEADGVSITSLLTVGDAAAAGNGYEMVGIPDGLGAFRQGANLVVFVNHELRAQAGIERAHGEKGAFISRLVIDPTTGRVKEGSDLVQPGVRYWDYPAGSFASAPVAPAGAAAGTHGPEFSRFCSGSLTTPGQLFNAATQRGYKGELYFANEESGDEGRVFAVTTSGEAHQLPRLGLFSWENTLAAPNTSDTTVVMGNEDAAGGQMWVYAGTKQKSGNAVEKAGLTNGTNFVLDLIDETVTTDAGFRTAFGKGTPAAFDLAEVDWNQSGANQNVEAAADGLTLNRIEDGAFNPANKNEYFFLTTEGGDKTAATTGSRDGGGLWKMTFADVERPELGGTLELVLDGSEGWGEGESRTNKPDNMTIDAAGNLLIQEDPGGNLHLARILSYRITDGARGVVARFDAARFSDSTTGLTIDEESSGIIQLADGSYLFDAQVHTAKGLPAGTGPNTVEEYVEHGQLLRMRIADFANVYDVFDD